MLVMLLCSTVHGALVHPRMRTPMAMRAKVIAQIPPPDKPEEVSAEQKLATALALGPMFTSQILGEQFFVPVYGPLLMLCGAAENRIDGPPAAITLLFATALYAGGVKFSGNAPETLSITIAINAVAALLLVVTESDEARARGRTEGSTLRGEDRGLALVLTLGLTLFLAATAIPVASLQQ